jgi:hypothetical protein
VRSTSFATLLFVTAVAGLGATRADAGICVNVAMHFASPDPSPALVATLVQEATAIWAPYDVELRWQSPLCTVEDASFEVRIERHLTRARGNRLVLGATRLQLTNIDRIPVVVDYDATEEMIGSLTVGQLVTLVGHWPVGPQELGRALGRIIAHEIGHVLLGLPNHQRQGLMRPLFGPTELVFPTRWQYTLSPLELARLRHRKGWIITNRNRVGSADHDEDELPADRHGQEAVEGVEGVSRRDRSR